MTKNALILHSFTILLVLLVIFSHFCMKFNQATNIFT